MLRLLALNQKIRNFSRMKINNSTCKNFRRVLDVLKDFLEETTMVVNPGGVGIADEDLSKTLFISLIIKKEDFNVYEVTKEQKISLLLKDIFKIFEKSKDEEAYEIEFSKDQINVKISGEVIRSYKLPLLNNEEKEISEPNFDFTSGFILPLETFHDIIRNGLVISEEITISIKEGKLNFLVDDHNKHGIFKISDSIKDQISIQSEVDLSSKYSLAILDRVLKAAKKIEATDCNVYLNDNFPIKLEFSKNNIKVSFYLGPRVSNEY